MTRAAAKVKGDAGPVKVSLDRARAHWHARQGLATPVKGKVDEVVATGHARSFALDTETALRERARLVKAL